VLVVLNRAPAARYRRGELLEEITTSLPVGDVAFVPTDRRVGDAAWNGTAVRRGSFTRAIDGIARRVVALPRRSSEVAAREVAS
jgi:hypothetical protein